MTQTGITTWHRLADLTEETGDMAIAGAIVNRTWKIIEAAEHDKLADRSTFETYMDMAIEDYRADSDQFWTEEINGTYTDYLNR
jgi:N-acetylneuraminic acid mutarotase